MRLQKLSIILLAAGAVVLLLSCSKTPVEPIQQPMNLVANPNFEVDGQPSLDSWTTALATLVQDAPTGDSVWCLQLRPGYIPTEGYAQTDVTGQSGIYKLTLWMKSISRWTGEAILGVWSNNRWLSRKSILNDSTLWTQVSLVDTLVLSPGDSIAVHLSAGTTEVAFGEARFDNITLVRIQ